MAVSPKPPSYQMRTVRRWKRAVSMGWPAGIGRRNPLSLRTPVFVPINDGQREAAATWTEAPFRIRGEDRVAYEAISAAQEQATGKTERLYLKGTEKFLRMAKKHSGAKAAAYRRQLLLIDAKVYRANGDEKKAIAVLQKYIKDFGANKGEN